MFRRRRRDPDEEFTDAVEADEPTGGEPGAEPEEVTAGSAEMAEAAGADVGADSVIGDPAARPDGPWDLDELPEGDDLPRVDLGGLLVPVRPDVELRVDMSPEGEVVAATLVAGASAMQVNAFAAPRTAGIWAEVREEIAVSLRSNGGSATEAAGPFGVELHARVPSEVPGQGRVLQPARFIGVDGPRWFLRGLLSGPAATDPVQAQVVEDAFRGIVVVRGKDAMAPRDQLPMRLPREVTEAGEQGGEQGGEPAGGPDIGRLERGPEIAETR